jgi:hypothetical protein
MAANFTKDPSELLDYQISWVDWLAAGETISTSTWTVASGLTEGVSSATTTVTTIWLSGGTNGEFYDVTNHIVTSAARTGDRTFTIQIVERTFEPTTGTTARQLITRTLSLIGALGEGESPTSSAASDALSTLNDMIQGWQAQQIPMHAITRVVEPIIASQTTYTIGSGGNINRAWPYRIERAGLLMGSPDPDVEVPIRVMLEQEWQGLAVKSMTSTMPTAVYYSPTYPLGTLYPYPVPTDATNSLILYLPEPVSTLSTLNTIISLPPGYERMLRYNLAVELSAEYGRPVDPVVQNMAAKTLADIMRVNFRPSLLRVDNALLDYHGAGRYNVKTDTGG